MTDDMFADVRKRDIPVPRSTLLKIRAVLASTPTARWELPDERTALVDSIDFILERNLP